MANAPQTDEEIEKSIGFIPDPEPGEDQDNDKDIDQTAKDPNNDYSSMSNDEIEKSIGFIPDAVQKGTYTPTKQEHDDFLTKALDHTANSIKRVGKDLAAGFGDVGQAVTNAPANTAQWLANRGALPYSFANSIPRPRAYDMNALYGIENPNLFDKAVRMAPGLAGMFAGGEAAGLAKAVPALEPYIAGLRPAAKGLARSGGIIAKNSLFGAGTNVAEGGNATSGALWGAGGGALGEGLNAGINALRPSNLFGKNVPAQELQKNLEATEGTDTPLGNVVKSPYLQGLNNNILAHVPFSGVTDNLAKVGRQVVDRGHELLNKLLGKGNTPGDTGKAVSEALNDNLKNLQDIKTQNFSAVNKEANDLGLEVSPNKFSDAAKKELERIRRSPNLNYEAERNSPELLEDLTHYANNTAKESLQDADMFKGKINKKARDASYKGDAHQVGIFNRLKNAYAQDVNDTIEKSGSSTLKEKHDTAMNFYRENIAPFEAPEVQKFTSKKGDPDTIISAFINAGSKDDRGNLLSKLVDKLPEDQKHLPAYGYLSKAIKDGELNPINLADRWKNLGEKQRAALVQDPALRKEFDNYLRLTKLNGESLSLMSNPKNGNRLAGWIPGGSVAAALVTGGVAPAIKTAGLAAGALYGSRHLAKLLRNESTRNNIAKKIMNGSNNAKVFGNASYGLASGIPAVYNAQQ